MQIWIQMSLSTRIVGSGATPLLHVEFRESNVSSVIVPTNWSIIVNLHGVAKQMKRPILWNWKPRKISHTLISSNVWIVKVNIKWTQIHVLFGNIILTRIGIIRNNRNFVIAEATWLKKSKFICRMFIRTTFSLIPFSNHISILTSFLFRNYCSLLFS